MNIEELLVCTILYNIYNKYIEVLISNTMLSPIGTSNKGREAGMVVVLKHAAAVAPS